MRGIGNISNIILKNKKIAKIHTDLGSEYVEMSEVFTVKFTIFWIIFPYNFSQQTVTNCFYLSNTNTFCILKSLKVSICKTFFILIFIILIF